MEPDTIRTGLIPYTFVEKEIRAFPNFQKPQVTGYFSIDKYRQYHSSLENLQYYNDHFLKKERLNLDLNVQYERYVQKPPEASKEKINHLLQFVQTNFEELQTKDSQDEKVIDIDFICFRGLLRLLMCAPYEQRDSWIILATKYKGTIYLCEEKTEEQLAKQQNISDRSKLFCSYGFKFEQYLLADSPISMPQPDRPVIESEEFCTMFKSKLEGNSILYGAEMDGVLTHRTINDLNDLRSATFIELKVKQEERNYHQQRNFLNNKQIKWWCQSFLVGINDVYVGLRSAKGIVYKVEKHEVKQMPRLARETVQDAWRPVVCMDFLNSFLKMVKEKLNGWNSAWDVMEFSFDPKNSGEILCKTYLGCKNSKVFLTPEYLNFIDKKS